MKPNETVSIGRYKVLNNAIFAVAPVLLLSVTYGQSRTEVDSMCEFLQSEFNFSSDDLSSIDQGEIVTESLEADSPAEVAVCAGVHLELPLEFALEMYREVETFKASSAVSEVGTFSTPPRLDDLDRLTLEEDDIKALQDCAPGHCEVKLPAAVMQQFRSEINWAAPDRTLRVLTLFRHVLIDYAKAYLTGGNEAMWEYDDEDHALRMGDDFREVLRESPNLFHYGPELFNYLDNFPGASLLGATNFICWQKEIFGRVKPVISLNHVTIYRPSAKRPVALVISKQIYANHYFEASLVERVLIGDDRGGLYVIYLNRSRFDDLRRRSTLFSEAEVRNEIYKKVKDELRWRKERLEVLYEESKRK
jgi:hypothetical protein